MTPARSPRSKAKRRLIAAAVRKAITHQVEAWNAEMRATDLVAPAGEDSATIDKIDSVLRDLVTGIACGVDAVEQVATLPDEEIITALDELLLAASREVGEGPHPLPGDAAIRRPPPRATEEKTDGTEAV